MRSVCTSPPDGRLLRKVLLVFPAAVPHVVPFSSLIGSAPAVSKGPKKEVHAN